jgi:hypothetical protein
MSRQLSPAGYRKLLDDGSPSTSVSEGLEYVPRSGRAEPRKQTAEQIRAEARARDPKSWERAEMLRKQKHEQGREASGDLAELYARRIGEALETDNEALIISRGREFAQASPEAWRAFCSELTEAHLEQLEELGYDPDDDDFPDESSLAGNFLLAAVGRAVDLERDHRTYAEAQAKVSGLVAQNARKYNAALDAAGITNDEEGIAHYEALKEYVRVSTGIDVGEMAYEQPELAASWVAKAEQQIDHWDAQLRRHAFGQQIVGAETSNVNEGLESGADREGKKLDELIDLQRKAQGLGPSDEPEAPAFGPDWEPEPTKEEQSDPVQSIVEFKASLRSGTGEEDTSVQADDAWTVGEPGAEQPTTFVQVTRDLEAEQRTEREARESATGLPRSFG